MSLTDPFMKMQSPADFLIELHSPDSLESLVRLSHENRTASSKHLFSTTTRRTYARIRIVDTGVRTPTSDAPYQPQIIKPVPFAIILEPLYLGVLPASMAPIVAFVVPLITLAAFILAPKVNHYLSRIAEQVRREMPVNDNSQRKSQ